MSSYRPYPPPPPPFSAAPPPPPPNQNPFANPYNSNPSFPNPNNYGYAPPPPPQQYNHYPPPPPPPIQQQHQYYNPPLPPQPPPQPAAVYYAPPPPPLPPPPERKPKGRVETEEERRKRKKAEYEKAKQLAVVKQVQANVLQKTQQISQAGRASLTGSRAAERRATLLGADRVENRLKKPTTFICKLKFRNELPDPTAQPKLLALNTNKDRYSKFAITSLEKADKPKLYPEHDLGIPLDLLDLSVYKAPDVCPPLDPEDEELLCDGEEATPVKIEGGIKRKDRPTDKGVSWLVKTQYISPLSMESARVQLTEKQAKEMRANKEGRNLVMDNLNNRERQIKAIQESFKAAKLAPVHQSNRKLTPVKILPLFPDFDRYNDQFVTVNFDGDPTADAENYTKLDRSLRDEHEAQAIMKSFQGIDPTKPEKFLAYMVPAPEEISKDLYDDIEEVNYSWVREYHWDVRGDDVADPTTYLVNFDNDVARYLPLPTKLVLQKKRAKEGRSSDEIEHYPVPSRVTVRRAALAVTDENISGRTSSSHGQVDIRNSKRSKRRDYSSDEE